MDVNAVVVRVRALCLDPAGDWATDAILYPLLNQAYEELYGELCDVNFPFNEETVVIPSLAVGTRDLRNYQRVGAPLERLFLPLDIEWKLAGNPDTDYKKVDERDRVKDVDSQSSSLESWEFSNGTIFLSPVDVAIDIRVRAQMTPIAVAQDGDQLIPGIAAILSLKTAAYILAPRNAPLAAGYERKGQKAQQTLEARYCKADQGKQRRWGRTFGRARVGGQMPRIGR